MMNTNAAPPPTGNGAPPSPPPQAGAGPGDPFHAELIARLRKLSPQDIAALVQGVSPPAIAVLKKLFPEIGMLIDQRANGGGMPPGVPPEAGGAPALPPGGGGGPPPRNMLRQIGG